jgi:ubiquitin-activating enzyme E1
MNKAKAAESVLRRVRPNVQVTSFEHFLNSETLELFNDSWFQQFEAVFATVDSFEAREFIDKRCAIYRLPLFTGGITSVTADWQTIIPGFTPRYGFGYSEQGSSFEIPSCTLKLFPFRQEHCIQWAHHQLNRIMHKKLHSFGECLQTAVEFFDSKFILRIKDLQHFHDKNERVNGLLFWSRHRIYPSCFKVDVNESYTRMFIVSCIKALASANAIPLEEIDFSQISLGATEWKPPGNELREHFADDPALHQGLIEDLFDRDNAVHLDFIESVSNLRSRNYGLGQIDRLLAQKVAGRIESAVSTTASVCSAGMFIEFLISRMKPEFACRGKYVVSPFSLMTFRECACPMKKLGDSEVLFSPWDFLKFDGKCRLDEVVLEIERKANRKIASWTTDDGLILPLEGQRFGLCGSMSDSFNELFQGKKMTIQIEVSLELLDGMELHIPPVLISLSD